MRGEVGRREEGQMRVSGAVSDEECTGSSGRHEVLATHCSYSTEQRVTH